jgi:hypothetical protein
MKVIAIESNNSTDRAKMKEKNLTKGKRLLKIGVYLLVQLGEASGW